MTAYISTTTTITTTTIVVVLVVMVVIISLIHVLLCPFHKIGDTLYHLYYNFVIFKISFSYQLLYFITIV